MDDGLVHSATDISSTKFIPSNTIIAFDLHDVIVKRDLTASAKQVPYTAWEYIKHPSFLFRVGSSRSFEDAYQNEHKDYTDSLEGVKDSTIALANCQVPMDGMAELLEQLAMKGCILYLFSNIGGIVLEDLKQKYPHLFQYFHGFHTPSSHNNFAKKPSNEAFKAFMDLYCSEREQTVIFVDDKQANIDSANRNGLIGILFQDVNQLRSHLTSLGL